MTTKSMLEAFGGRLKLARQMNKLSQAQVALHFGITRQAVSAWENSVTMPNTPQLIELVMLYGIPLDMLVLGLECMPVALMNDDSGAPIREFKQVREGFRRLVSALVIKGFPGGLSGLA